MTSDDCRLSGFGLVSKVQPSPLNSPSMSLGDAEIERREVFFHGRFQECPIYEQERLPAQAAITGPAIIEEFGATITSDAGLLAARELDEALGPTELAADHLQESRTGRNVHHQLVSLHSASSEMVPAGKAVRQH